MQIPYNEKTIYLIITFDDVEIKDIAALGPTLATVGKALIEAIGEIVLKLVKAP